MAHQSSADARLTAALEALRDAGATGLSLRETHALAEEYGCAVRVVEERALAVGLAPTRYARNLGTTGLGGQARLLRACVAVVGCGGLGGWIIEVLARMGVGRLVLIDGDRFEESNLNRQAGSLEGNLGRPKAECLTERVRAVNGAVEAVAHVTRLTPENAPALLAGAEVVVDALDTLPDRLTLSRAAAALGVPLVHGAIGGYTGQVMTILPGDPGLEGLYGDAGWPARGVEVELGNPAATPMMVAAWQAQEVIKLLLGVGEVLRHRLLVLDAEYGEVTDIHIT
jgi:molybdopterin/thiamine biosynthesis adenylyltransferase